MRRLSIAAIVVAVAGLPLLAFAQVAEHFDTSRTVTIKGAVVEFAVGPGPRSFLLLESKDAAGKVELWAVEGKGVGELVKSGWNVKGQVPPGTQLTATAYALKPGAAMVTPPAGAPERVATAANARRLTHGIDVVFPDGKTLPFGAR